MAEIQQQPSHRRGRRRPHASVRVDMTPLVDLAFLLLTFFVLTTELSKQNAITTKFPAKGEDTKVNNGLTVLLGKNPEKIYWYRGEFASSVHLNVVTKGNKELLNVLKNANESVFEQIESINRLHNLGLMSDVIWKQKTNELMKNKSIPFVIVKWDEDANYGSVVTVLDDLIRVHDNNYAVVSTSDAEKELVSRSLSGQFGPAK